MSRRRLWTRLIQSVRSYFVSFWAGILVCGGIALGGLTFIVRYLLHRQVPTSSIMFVLGMVIGSVCVLVRLLTDLSYWKVEDR